MIYKDLLPGLCEGLGVSYVEDSVRNKENTLFVAPAVAQGRVMEIPWSFATVRAASHFSTVVVRKA